MDWYIGVLKKYAVFNGRARRKEYWYFVLFNLIISIVLAIIDNFTGTYDAQTGMGLLGIVYALAVLVPGLAVTFRRLHDAEHTAWWFLILLIPLVGALVFLFFMVQAGTPGRNEYGEDPIQDEFLEVE